MPLGKLIDQGSELLDPKYQPLFAKLKGFYEQVLPQRERSKTRLSSYVHGFAEISNRGPLCLRENVKHHLLRVDRPTLESLPGHRPRMGRGVTGFLNFSNLLNRLITRESLQSFVFVSRASS